MSGKGVLVTGGQGQLGKALRPLLPQAIFLGREEMNIMRSDHVVNNIARYKPKTVLHLAAYTAVAHAENERDACYALNVTGTMNVVEVCRRFGIKLVYISTDYVFDGKKGMYRINDPHGPVNWYGHSKGEGERIALGVGYNCVVRTSFKPSVFPYPKAFEDLWTSADYIDVIAPLVVEKLDKEGVFHVGTERKSIFELIKRRNPTVEPMLREEVPVPLPRDVSMICN